uniref:hypothetical protein n=1 Tax=Haloprofundus sp. MHR1 TaxID=2572921 RepID=UPI001F3D9F69|nr:hypothetical protein [Haloprofundus sp. MHR1]
MKKIPHTHIKVDYTDELWQKVTEAARPSKATNPIGDISIRVGERYVLGKPESSGSEYLAEIIGGMLQAVPDIVSNKRAVIELNNGPAYLVFDPVDSPDQIGIAYRAPRESALNPKERLSIEEAVRANKRQTVNEILGTGTEYLRRFKQRNENLQSAANYRGIEEDLEHAIRIYRQESNTNY